MATKIILADDHRIMLEGLRTLIRSQPGMTVVGEAEDGQTAVELALELSPDIAVMDITMPGLNGIDAASRITSESGNTKIIVLSMHADKMYVIKAFKAGVRGYLLKKSAFNELICAIQTVSDNGVYISSSIANIVIENFIRSLSSSRSLVSSILTDRESEVLKHIAEGKSTKEIALSLYVSAKTVETHRKKIMDKLEMHSIAALTKYAIREGLTSID